MVNEGSEREQEVCTDEEMQFLGSVNMVGGVDPLLVEVALNGKTLKLEIDTGAAVTKVGKKVWEELGKPKLIRSCVRLKDFSGAF